MKKKTVIESFSRINIYLLRSVWVGVKAIRRFLPTQQIIWGKNIWIVAVCVLHGMWLPQQKWNGKRKKKYLSRRQMGKLHVTRGVKNKTLVIQMELKLTFPITPSYLLYRYKLFLIFWLFSSIILKIPKRIINFNWKSTS